MIAGGPLYLQKFVEDLGRVFGLRVLAARYPLCPDVSAATAVDAGVEAYLHLINDLGVNPKRVIVAGESGGGQMTLLVCQSLLGRGLPLPAAALAMCPVCNFQEDAVRARYANTTDAMIDAAFMDVIHGHLRRVGKPDEVPVGHASYNPYSGPVVGLPPTYFLYDTGETLAFECGQMAGKIRAAGVPVAEDITAWGIHGGPAGIDCPEAIEAFTRAAAWLKPFLASE